MSDLMSFKKNMEFLRMPLPSDSSVFGLQAGKAISVMLAEGDAITIKGASALSTGTVNSPNGLQNFSLSAGGSLIIGPFVGRRKIAINVTSGGIDALVSSAIPIAGQQLPALAQRVTRSNILEDQVYGTVQAQAQTATNFTYHMTIVIPTDATEFQIVLDNVSTTLPFRIKSAAIATSDSIGADVAYGVTTGQVRFTPQNGTAWKPLTWDGGTANVEIAVSPVAGRKTRKSSDYIVASTPTNVDGSKLRIVMVRLYVEGTGSSPGNGYCTGAYPLTWRTLAVNVALHKGFIWQCIRYTGDGVTTPATFQPTTDLSALPFVTCIRYKTRKPGIVINCVGGDSIPAGAVNSFSGNFGNGWLWQLVNLLRDKYPNIPFSLSNNGFPSTGTAIYYQNALDYISAGAIIGLPIYQPVSQNDGTPSKAQYDVSMGRMATVSAVLQDKGKTVVLMTPIVNTSLAWTAPQDAIRLALRQEILDMQSFGLNVVLDMESVSDGATPARYQGPLTIDLAHPNEPGGAVIAADNLARISLMIG